MLKRVLIVGFAMVAALAIAIVACGRSQDTVTTITTDSTESTAAGPSSTVAPQTTTTRPAAATASNAVQAPVTLKYATRFGRTDAGGKVIQRFIDYVEDATAGLVTFEVFFGGALGNNLEELGLVGSGSVDMTSPSHSVFADRLPLLNIPMWAPPDAQAVLDYFDHLVFQDPNTSALVQAEAAANNIVYLGFICGGGNVFISTRGFSGLGDLVGRKCGAGGSVPAFEGLGCTVVKTSAAKMYDALSGGAYEATRVGFKTSVDLKLYEVAKHYMWDGIYAAGNPFVVNLETWTKLTPETRAILHEAAKDAAAFSLELDAGDTAAGLHVLGDAGVKVGSLGAEDQAAWYQLLFENSARDSMSRAQTLGIVADMTLVLTKAARFTGVTWPPPVETGTTAAQ